MVSLGRNASTGLALRCTSGKASIGCCNQGNMLCAALCEFCWFEDNIGCYSIAATSTPIYLGDYQWSIPATEHQLLEGEYVCTNPIRFGGSGVYEVISVTTNAFVIQGQSDSTTAETGTTFYVVQSSIVYASVTNAVADLDRWCIGAKSSTECFYEIADISGYVNTGVSLEKESACLYSYEIEVDPFVWFKSYWTFYYPYKNKTVTITGFRYEYGFSDEMSGCYYKITASYEVYSEQLGTTTGEVAVFYASYNTDADVRGRQCLPTSEGLVSSHSGTIYSHSMFDVESADCTLEPIVIVPDAPNVCHILLKTSSVAESEECTDGKIGKCDLVLDYFSNCEVMDFPSNSTLTYTYTIDGGSDQGSYQASINTNGECTLETQCVTLSENDKEIIFKITGFSIDGDTTCVSPAGLPYSTCSQTLTNSTDDAAD